MPEQCQPVLAVSVCNVLAFTHCDTMRNLLILPKAARETSSTSNCLGIFYMCGPQVWFFILPRRIRCSFCFHSQTKWQNTALSLYRARRMELGTPALNRVRTGHGNLEKSWSLKYCLKLKSWMCHGISNESFQKKKHADDTFINFCMELAETSLLSMSSYSKNFSC